MVLIVIYVDDLIVTSDNDVDIDEVKLLLKQKLIYQPHSIAQMWYGDSHVYQATNFCLYMVTIFKKLPFFCAELHILLK